MLSRSAHSTSVPVLESFARKVSQSRIVWTVSGEDGLARIPTSSKGARDATLCWSTGAEAEHYAARVSRHGRVNPIMLGNFQGAVLPKLRSLGRLVAPDWTADPFHPHFEVTAVEQSLAAAGFATFVECAAARNRVFILEGDLGPTFAASVSTSGQLTLPCWTASDAAEAQIKGFWADMMVSEIGLEAFVGRTLPWLAGIRRGASLDHGLGGIVMELGALDLAARLMRVHAPAGPR